MSQRAPPNTTPEFAATHAVSSIDEADVVVPRLVGAVLRREPFGKGARMPTVTAQESAPFRNRPGAGLRRGPRLGGRRLRRVARCGF